MKILFYILSFVFLCCNSISSFGQALPTKPARKISFTTHEGSNINVDLSPDGKTLIFDLLGQLFTVSVKGGPATQLTQGIANYILPMWSPDGKHIACISDETGVYHLTIRNFLDRIGRPLDRTGPQIDIFNYARISWGGDAKSIFFKGDKYPLFGKKTPFGKILLRFSPDENSDYYFENDHLITAYNRLDKTAKLVSANRYGGICELSPNLRWAAYQKDTLQKRELVIVELTTRVERVLVPSLFENLSTYRKTHFTFSPDSKNIFIGYKGKIHRLNIITGANDIIPFTAKVNLAIGPQDYHTFRVNYRPFNIKFTRSANESPDGKHIVFSALDKVWIMNLPNGRPHLLVAQNLNQFQPIFSPDSKRVAYVSWCDSTGGQLWCVASSGGKPSQLTCAASQYQRPAWSPDGKTIAVVKGGPENSDRFKKDEYRPELTDRDDSGTGKLLIISLDDGKIRSLNDSVPLWNQITFSFDGKEIYYNPLTSKGPYSHFQYNHQPRSILMVEADLRTGKQNTLVLGPPDPDEPHFVFQQASISPNGKYLVYERGEDLYLLAMAGQKKPLTLDKESNLSVVRFAHGLDPCWENGGKILSWSYGNRFSRIDPEKIIRTAKRQTKNKISNAFGDSIIRVEVKPDQLIKLQLTATPSYAHGTLVLKNARILTMEGNTLIRKGMIVIKNSRIVYVGPNSEMLLKNGDVFDLSGKTIIPGFVDLHLHMHVPPDVFPQQSWMYLANLAYGVTTARDPFTSYGSFGYEELLKSGQMIGPRLFSSGRGAYDDQGIIINQPSDAVSLVNQRKTLGGTFIKQYLLPTRLQREWLVQASNAAGLNMTNEGDLGNVFNDIGMIKDGNTGIEHNPEWGDAYYDIITLFARSGIFFTPTLQNIPEPNGGTMYFDSQFWSKTSHKMQNFMPENVIAQIHEAKYKVDDSIIVVHQSQVDAKIRKAGGRVTLGSHGNVQGLGVHNELWALQMGGLSNMQALQAATIMGAEAIGIQKDVGSIKVGKIADMIILNSNPLDDIHNSRDIKYVMKDGILYNGGSLDELWPEKKKCPDWRLHIKSNDNPRTTGQAFSAEDDD